MRTKRMSGLSCHRLPKSIVAESRRKPGPIRVHYPIYLRGTSTILIRGDRSAAHLSASEWSTKLRKDGSTERFTNYIHSRLRGPLCSDIYLPCASALAFETKVVVSIYYLLVDHTYTYLQTPLCDCAGERTKPGTKARRPAEFGSLRKSLPLHEEGVSCPGRGLFVLFARVFLPRARVVLLSPVVLSCVARKKKQQTEKTEYGEGRKKEKRGARASKCIRSTRAPVVS